MHIHQLQVMHIHQLQVMHNTPATGNTHTPATGNAYTPASCSDNITYLSCLFYPCLATLKVTYTVISELL